MNSEIDAYAYLASMSALLVLMGALAGAYAKFVSVMVGTLAYPAYLAIYGMEFFLAPGQKKERKFFGFNLPKSGTARYISHWLGTAVTLLLLFPMGFAFYEALVSPEKQLQFFVSVMYGWLLPPSFLVIPLGCLLTLYIVSWRTELDPSSPMEKIEALSIPALWKKAIGI